MKAQVIKDQDHLATCQTPLDLAKTQAERDHKAHTPAEVICVKLRLPLETQPRHRQQSSQAHLRIRKTHVLPAMGSNKKYQEQQRCSTESHSLWFQEHQNTTINNEDAKRLERKLANGSRTLMRKR
jgi:hypothetical protein